MHTLISTTNTPTYKTAAIMALAWQWYDQHNCLGDRKRFPHNHSFFAQMLRAAWAEAHKQMEAAKLAALSQQERTERRTELESELDSLTYLPIGMSYTRRAEALRDELSKLAA